MQFLGEVDGKKWYWAAPGRFQNPGAYYWDGKSNVRVSAGQPVSEGLTESQSIDPDDAEPVFTSYPGPILLDPYDAERPFSSPVEDRVRSAVPPAKAEGMSDTERLDGLFSMMPLAQFCATLGISQPADASPRSLGAWARSQIDAAILAQQAKGEQQ